MLESGFRIRTKLAETISTHSISLSPLTNVDSLGAIRVGYIFATTSTKWFTAERPKITKKQKNYFLPNFSTVPALSSELKRVPGHHAL